MAETLTKSRFVLGLDCPQKLVYQRDPSYRNLRLEDAFLHALADGGAQVAEFAKAHFHEGQKVETLEPTKALEETDKLLRRENVVIFEAAFRWRNCFIRIDILEKRGQDLHIYEIKGKSFDSRQPTSFKGGSGAILSDWKPYLYDVAFQKFVLQNAYPAADVCASLMLVDKSSVCPIDNLNRYFEISLAEGRVRCNKNAPIPEAAIDAGILKSVSVDQICQEIYESQTHGSRLNGSFEDVVAELSDICEGSRLPVEGLAGSCGACEFKRVNDSDPLRSGFEQCVERFLGARPLNDSLIFDLSGFRARDKALEAGIIYLADLTDESIGHPAPYVPGRGLSPSQRRKIQLEKVKAADPTTWFDPQGWSAEEATWKYPLHFIDFETTRVALPFFANHHPYQSVAFQFSHHKIDRNGDVEHATQFLDTSSKRSPNLEFVRSLRNALGEDDGTIFMYTPHENTTLLDIYNELASSPAEDAAELRKFLREIVRPQEKSAEKWIPSRPMKDQCEIVKKYLYLPRTAGRNSLKYVLPAMLQSSQFLQEKYRNPLYGKHCKIPSLNRGPTRWVQFDDTGSLVDPYSALPELTAGMSRDEANELWGLEVIAHGGAALTAYSRLLGGGLTDASRERLASALLMYCELDSLGMVFLHEGMESFARKGC